MPARPPKPVTFTTTERLLISLVVGQAQPLGVMPNLEAIVHAVRNSQPWDFSTKDGLCSYSNAVVYALHQADPLFGHLQKSEAQNHCVDPEGRNCATDVALYLSTGQIVDFIQSAGYGTPPPPNNVCWLPGPVGEYPAGAWFAPVAGSDSGGGTPDGGGGEVPADTQAQLDRMEATLNAQSQEILQMKLYLSNMNDQLALQGGVVNQTYALCVEINSKV